MGGGQVGRGKEGKRLMWSYGADSKVESEWREEEEEEKEEMQKTFYEETQWAKALAGNTITQSA